MDQISEKDSVVLKETLEAIFDDFFRLELAGGLMFGPDSWSKEERTIVSACFMHIYTRTHSCLEKLRQHSEEALPLLVSFIIKSWNERFTTAKPLPYAKQAKLLVSDKEALLLPDDAREGLCNLFSEIVRELQAKAGN